MELYCLLIILAMFSLDRSVVSANGLFWRQHVFHDHNTNRYNVHIPYPRSTKENLHYVCDV